MPSQNIHFTEKHAEFVRQSVETGDFKDASEVVRAGLRLLEEWQAERRRREAELRAMLLEAKAGGVVDRSPREVWESVEARCVNRDA